MKPQSFAFMGRYGSGKGTQSKLLMDYLKKKDSNCKVLYIETGQEFRNFIKGTSYSAGLTKKTIEAGKLMPEFMPVYLWAKLLTENYNGTEQLVFDGTPRKLMEAEIFDSIFPYYGLDKPWIIYLDVGHEEAIKRLSIRARSGNRLDDGEEQIKARKIAYENDITPTIEYYRKSPNVNFLDIEGHRSVEEIHADIVKKLGLE